jgi:hypothetical protein
MEKLYDQYEMIHLFRSAEHEKHKKFFQFIKPKLIDEIDKQATIIVLFAMERC